MYFDSRLVRGIRRSPPSLLDLDSHQRLGARPRELISSLLMLRLAMGDRHGL